jgi:hypothetical protein
LSVRNAESSSSQVPECESKEHISSFPLFLGIPVKVNIDSGGKPNGIPE